MRKLKDCLWIWGQEPGSHGGASYNIPPGNTVTPVEGAKILGIPNCCRVVMHNKPEPPFDTESERMKDLKQVVWSGLGDASSLRNDRGSDDVSEVLRQAAKHPNVRGCILDDFFLASGPRIAPERMLEIRKSLHAAGLTLWMVSYDLDWRDFPANKDYFDVISFWTWNGFENHLIEGRLRRLHSMLSPGQKAMAGCYLWNYHGKCPLTEKEMNVQCNAFRKLLGEGIIDGVIICSNTVLGLGIESEQIIRKWIGEAGDDPVPGR